MMENEGYDKDEPSQEVNDRKSEHSVSTIHMPDEGKPADKPYSGMGKEDLLRFSDTPFWNTLRLVFLVIFWLGWVALLGAVIGLTVAAPRCEPAPSQQWWQKTTFYQIYVRSFYDSDEDGIGDLNGITEKLDYLSSLNIEAIMLSSFYEGVHTDGADFGYEVTNHMAVDPVYGAMTDFDDLLQEAHDRGIKVIIDFIPNHTGNEHNWFTNWAADNGNEDYYISTPQADVNNWVSVYGGSAWTTYDGGPNVYLHQLLETQPDLNLRNKAVMDELEAILRFWLDKGVDGFRVVGAKYLVEDYSLRDEVPIAGCADTEAYECYNHTMTASQPENVGLLNQWRAIVDSYSNEQNEFVPVLLSDAKESIENDIMYYGLGEADAAQLPIHYQLLQSLSDVTCGGDCVSDVVTEWLLQKPDFATLNWMTGHQDELRLTSARESSYTSALSMLRMTLPGSSFVYYGEELGMVDGNLTESGCLDPGFNRSNGNIPCRDEARTPMQWDDSPNGGFTNDSQPWLPVNGDYTTVNVQDLDDENNEYSPLMIFRRLAELRMTSTALHYGDTFITSAVTNNLFSFIRAYDGTDRYLISVNFGTEPDSAVFAGSHSLVPETAEVVMFNRPGYSSGQEVNLNNAITLDPGDGIILTTIRALMAVITQSINR